MKLPATASSSDALVESLPTVSKGKMYIISDKEEQNVMTTVQVKAAKKKGWTPQYTDGSLGERKTLIWKEYKGSSQ